VDVVWVFLGGGCGAVARWGLSIASPQPWGTVAINLVGCALLAVLMHPDMRVGGAWKLALATGFMGSFTTYSTFNFFVLAALKEQDWGSAAAQVAVTLIGGLLAGAAGWFAAGWWRAGV